MIPKGTIKLAVILEEHPRVSTIVTEFLTVNYLSAFNGVIGKPLLRALKVVTSIHYLTMNLSMTPRIGKVQGKYWDSRECYNKSLELAKRKRKATPSPGGRKDKQGANRDKH